MLIRADNITFDGTEHQFCQDYSLSNENGEIPFIVVSDGCSNSNYTEFGSQLVCHIVNKLMTEADIKTILNHKLFIHQIIELAQKSIKIIGISDNCLLVTLSIAFFYKNHIYVYVWGDGCVVTIGNNEQISIQQIEYDQNTPFYPIYDNPIDTNNYINSLTNNNDSLTNKNITIWNKEGNVYINSSLKLKFNEPIIKRYKIDDIKAVILTTDGIDSFLKEREQKKSIVEIIDEYLNFNDFKGQFLKRSIKNHTEKLYQEEFFNYDDVSIAALFVK